MKVDKPKKRLSPRPPVLRDPPRVIKSKWRFFITLILIFAAAGSIYWFFRSEYFAVTEIEVRGQERLLGESIVDSTGLGLGVNIWQIDILRVEEHLLNNPRIRSVYVQKYLPNKIVIQVDEYGPLALIPTESGFAEIDENSTVMSFTDTIAQIDLPIVTGITLTEPVSGLKAEGLYLDEVLECVIVAQELDHLGLVEFNVDENGGITLVTLEGIRILLGSSDEGFQKAFDVLRPILVDIRETRASVAYIDMRAPDKPVVKLK